MEHELEYPIKSISGKDSLEPSRVYLVRNGKQISRIFTPPSLPPSPERDYVLSLTQLLRETWYTLENKEEWDQAATQVSNLWDPGISYPLGMNLFLNSNFYRYLHNQTINLTPPQDTTVPLLTLHNVELYLNPSSGEIRCQFTLYHEIPGGAYLYPRLSPSSPMPDKKHRLWEYKSLVRLGTGSSVTGPYTPSIYTIDTTTPGQIVYPGQWARLQVRPITSSFISGYPLTFGPVMINTW